MSPIIICTLKRTAVVAVFLAGTSTAVFAQEDSRRGPPPEAIEACANQAENDSCSFTGRMDDTLEGVCVTLPNSRDLACAPENARPPKQQ